jgi:hypothetical protein
VEEDSLMQGGQHLFTSHPMTTQTDFKIEDDSTPEICQVSAPSPSNWPFHLNLRDGIRLVVARGAASMSKLSSHPDSTLLKTPKPRSTVD